MAERSVRVRSVRSDGQVFEYEGDDWRIMSLEGVDFPKFEITQKNRGYGNGSIITGKRKEARDIDLVVRESNRKNNIADRLVAIGFHNSNYEFDLYFTYMGTTRIARGCQLQGAKCPSGNVHDALVLTVSYLHPESDLLGENSESASFTAVDPVWHVTRAYPPGGGKLPYGVVSHATKKVVNYLGSEDTYVKITVEATGLVQGVAVGIGKVSVTVNATLASGDILEVDSEKKTVAVNGADVPPANYDGEFLPGLVLAYGDNVVTVRDAADGGNTAFNAEVAYTGRYGGL